MLDFKVAELKAGQGGPHFYARAFVSVDGATVVVTRQSYVNGMSEDEFRTLRGEKGSAGEHPAWISRTFIPWSQLHRGTEKLEEVASYMAGVMADLGIEFFNARPETTHRHKTEPKLAASLIPAQEGGV